MSVATSEEKLVAATRKKKAEERLVAATKDRRALESARDKGYDKWLKVVREVNADGVSYERIAKITGLSKTQVQRLCGA